MFISKLYFYYFFKIQFLQIAKCAADTGIYRDYNKLLLALAALYDFRFQQSVHAKAR